MLFLINNYSKKSVTNHILISEQHLLSIKFNQTPKDSVYSAKWSILSNVPFWQNFRNITAQEIKYNFMTNKMEQS